MEPNSSPALPAATDAPQTDSYGFPLAGDLSTDDMSDADLEAFVDKTLGVTHKESSDATAAKPVTPVSPETETAVAGSPSPTPAPAVPATTPTEEVKPTPELNAEVPALDTSDLWLEVVTAGGEKARLNLDEGIPDDFLFASDKQLFEVLDAFNEMKQIRHDREATIEKALADKATTEADLQTQQSTMNSWATEIQDLVDAGLIDKTEKQPADGKIYSPQEIGADPGLKLTNDVFAYMKDENSKRQTAGKAPLTSFTAAFTLYKKQSDAASEVALQKQKNEHAKQRGALVGGTAAPAGSDKGYTYKRGSARNIWQVDTSDI